MSVVERERDQTAIALAARGFAGALSVAEPLAADARKAVLAELDKELAAAGLLDDKGEVSQAAKTRFGWERTVLLPTAGVVVKGCLDECNICEPELQRRMELENTLLERQIELLEKSQEYRCCPSGSAASEPG